MVWNLAWLSVRCVYHSNFVMSRLFFWLLLEKRMFGLCEVRMPGFSLGPPQPRNASSQSSILPNLTVLK